MRRHDNKSKDSEEDEELDDEDDESEEGKVLKSEEGTLEAASLEEMAVQPEVKDKFEGSEFVALDSSSGEFVAPVLAPDDTATPNLEVATDSLPIPAVSSVDAGGGQVYSSTSSGYSTDTEYEGATASYETLEGRRREREERRERFDIRGGLIADTSDLSPRMAQTVPIAQGPRGGMRETRGQDDIEEFVKQQRKYREAEEDKAPTFLRRRRRAKGL